MGCTVGFEKGDVIPQQVTYTKLVANLYTQKPVSKSNGHTSRNELRGANSHNQTEPHCSGTRQPLLLLLLGTPCGDDDAGGGD